MSQILMKKYHIQAIKMIADAIPGRWNFWIKNDDSLHKEYQCGQGADFIIVLNHENEFYLEAPSEKERGEDMYTEELARKYHTEEDGLNFFGDGDLDCDGEIFFKKDLTGLSEKEITLIKAHEEAQKAAFKTGIMLTNAQMDLEQEMEKAEAAGDAKAEARETFTAAEAAAEAAIEAETEASDALYAFRTESGGAR